MSKADKFLKKLQNGTISAKELETLLKQLGWSISNQKGSHVSWKYKDKRVTVATHGKEVPAYQIKQIKKALEE